MAETPGTQLLLIDQAAVHVYGPRDSSISLRCSTIVRTYVYLRFDQSPVTRGNRLGWLNVPVVVCVCVESFAVRFACLQIHP